MASVEATPEQQPARAPVSSIDPTDQPIAPGDRPVAGWKIVSIVLIYGLLIVGMALASAQACTYRPPGI